MSERRIRVTGKGHISVKPDMTRIKITLSDVKPDYNKALTASADDTDKLKELLAKYDIAEDEIKTLSFNIDGEYDRSLSTLGKRKLTGYKYKHVLKIEFPSDNEKLADIIRTLSNKSSLNPEISFTFFVKDTATQINELIKRGVDDARTKAEVLANSSGVSLNEIESIEYSWGNISFEVNPVRHFFSDNSIFFSDDYDSFEDDGVDFSPFTRKKSVPDFVRALNIVPDNIEVTDDVTVIWSIL